MNQVILGDSLHLINGLESESIDLIATDPPYLIDYKTNYIKNRKVQEGTKMVDHDRISSIENDSNPQLIVDIIPELYRVLKDDSALYMFCSMDKVDFFKQEVEKYFNLKNIIIWVKNNWTAGDLKAQYGKQYEMILYANKGRRLINGKRLTDVWNFDRISGKKQVHQNEKPLDLMEQIIIKSSNEGDIVLDPFAGSGTTLVAAKRLGRQYIGYEIDKKYIELCNNKLAKTIIIKQDIKPVEQSKLKF